MIGTTVNWALCALQCYPLSWGSTSTALTNLENGYCSCSEFPVLPFLGAAESVAVNWKGIGLTPLWNAESHHSPSHNDDIALPSKSKFFDIPKTGVVQVESGQKWQRGKEIFSRGWPDQASDTVCGWGSSERHTHQVREELAEIMDKYHVEKLNDAGCGDLAWISRASHIGDVDYVGYDLYERATWPKLRENGFHLDVLDITLQDMRPSDVIICRDVLIHLPNDMVLPTLERFRHSASLLLATSYTSDSIECGEEFSNLKRMNEPSLRHAKLDMTLPPFNLGQPLVRISEDSPCKYLGLWNISSAPI